MRTTRLGGETVLLNEKEVAKLTGLSRRCLAEWRKLKKGPRYLDLSQGKGGRSVIRYRRSDIERWLTESTIETETMR